MQCEAKTKHNKQCKRKAQENSQYCFQHQPLPADVELNTKQKRFAEEYIKDHNAKQAAIRAGYSKHTAKVQGSRLLSNANVKRYIDELIKSQTSRTLIDADMIIKEIAKIAFIDITDFIDQKDQLLHIKDLKELKGITSAIKSIKQTGFGIEIQTHNKDRALKELLDHVAIDKNEHERLQIEKERIILDRERITLQRQQLELSKDKAGRGEYDQENTGIIVMPEATEGNE